MLTSIRRITTISLYRSSRASDGPLPCWVLHQQFPFSTATALQPNTTALQDPILTLQTLKDYGFTDTQIAEVARKAPWISSSRSKDLLRSRTSYLFNDSGLDRSFLVKFISSYPAVLQSSLENAIIPSIAYLDSILRNRDVVAQALGRAPVLLQTAHTTVASNIEMLKDYGVPDSHIAKSLVWQPRSLTCGSEKLRELLNSVLSLKFDPSSTLFIHAIRVKSGMSDSTWEKKVKAYVSCGWSVEDAHLAFKRAPFTYATSEQKIKKVFGFLSNVLKLRVADVLTYPNLMNSSLEKTLIPRCCVLNVLMGRGLLKTAINVPSALNRSAETFEKMYVEKYQDDVPQVLEAYKGNMEFMGFDHLRKWQLVFIREEK